MRTRPWWFYKQSAVIPYRRNDGQEPEILLITSRGSGRWIIPKGIIDPGKTAPESAANEAYEEAGVRGRISSSTVGEYNYEKWGGTCHVQVFLLEVEKVLDDWPEMNARRREWMPPEMAAASVREEELKSMILALRGEAGESGLRLMKGADFKEE